MARLPALPNPPLIMPHCSHCKKEDAKHKCKYCRNAVYCDAKCATIAWHTHAEECNVINVPEPNMTAFVPYVGEDCAPEDFLERLDPDGPTGQTYLVRYVDPAGAIVQHEIAPVAGEATFKTASRGMGWGAPGKELDTMEYALKIVASSNYGPGYSKEIIIPGLMIGETAMHSNAKGKAGLVSKLNFTRMRFADRSTLVLWPGIEKIEAAGELQVPRMNSSLSIQMLVGGEVVASIYGNLEFTKKTGSKYRMFMRKLKGADPWKREFKAKLGASRDRFDDFSALEMLRGTSNDGISAQVVFQVTRDADGVSRDTVSLRDLEIRVPKITLQDVARRQAAASEPEDVPSKRATAPPNDAYTIPPTPAPPAVPAESGKMVTTQFALDADNIDHMRGLIMALEAKMTAGDIENFDDQFDTLNEHCQKLEEAIRTDSEYTTDPHVHNLVRTATQMCWEQVGRRYKAAFDKNYYNLHKDKNINIIVKLVDNLHLPTPGSTKERFKAFARGIRGKQKGRMQALLNILNERIGDAELGKVDPEIMKRIEQLSEALGTNK